MEIKKSQIISPRDLWWEAGGVFNPAAVSHKGKIYLVYRAVGADRISRFGLAVSDDGEDFLRFPDPWYEAPESDQFERLGVEDPRAVVINDTVLITYTSASVYPAKQKNLSSHSIDSSGTPWRIRVSALTTKDFSSVERCGQLINNIDSKNAAFLPKKMNDHYVLFHRIAPSIFITKSQRLSGFEGGVELLRPRQGWEELRIGIGPPPVLLDEGFLVIYHGISSDFRYSAGAALLDAFSPFTVRDRASRPFLAPTESWEKKGVVKNVVFPTGTVVKHGKLHIFYGAADYSIGRAIVDIKDVLATVQN